MGLKQTLENHIVVVAVGITLVSAGAVYKVVDFFYERERSAIEAEHRLELSKLASTHSDEIHDLKKSLTYEIEGLKSRVISIERRLGGQKYLDIRELFTPESHREGVTHVRYIEQGDFFAPENFGNWRHEVTTELKLIGEITGVDTNYLPQELVEALTAVPIFVWRGQDEYVLEDAMFEKLFPHILVQKFPLEYLSMALKGGFALAKAEQIIDETEVDDGSAMSSISDKDIEDKILKGVTTMFKNDAVGTLFMMQLTSLSAVALEEPNVNFSLRNIQKVGPVLYAQIVYKISDVVVNGVPKANLFLVQEIFAISRSDSIYLLRTNIIADTPSFTGGYFNDVNLWLGGFYLPEH